MAGSGMATVETETGFTRDALDRLNASNGKAPLTELREQAFRQFEAMPLPSAETEEWRYTDIRGLDLSTYHTDGEERPVRTLDEVPAAILAAAGHAEDRAGLAIQHNSTVISAHLSDEEAAKGVTFLPLDLAVETHPELVRGRLHGAVPAGRTKFTALHAAFRRGGTFLHVPAGVRVEAPLQSLTYVDLDRLSVFPHTVLVVDEGADVTFIDRYVSPDLGGMLSDAVVEIYAGPASRIRYVSVQEWGDGVTHLSVQRALVGRDAEVRSLTAAFGATLSRTEVESVLAEPGGFSEMLGVYFASGDQHFDHRSLQDHVAPHCSSDLLYKGVLKGRSNTIYSGTVAIRPEAQKSDAFQTNRNLVLSDEAKANAIPNLEIEANDVRCGHAVSAGPVDEDMLFYIQSRGIPYTEAERLVVFGFLREVLDRVTLSEVRDSAEAAIEAELSGEE